MKVGDTVRVFCCEEHANAGEWYISDIVNGLLYVVLDPTDTIPLRLFDWQVELIEEEN